MKLLTLLLLVVPCSVANAQTTLHPGSPIERELQPGQFHQYTINLAENQFIQITVDQRAIDVMVRVFSPSGKSLGEFDTPNDDDGPEHVSFVAVTGGSYRITVGPLAPKDTTATGRYEIKIVELRRATDLELKTSKNVEVTKAKGVALLADIETMIPQIKSAHTRIKAQLQTAQLLWDVDQKRALSLFADAAAGLKEFVASIDPGHIHFFSQTIAQLRLEIVQALASRDPDAALSFIQSTNEAISSAFDKGEFFKQESVLELSIADQIMHKNPKRALQMARQNLKRGYSPNLTNTLFELLRKDPESGVELANEITTKIVSEKLLKRHDAGYVAANLLRFISLPEDNPESTKGSARPPFLSNDRIRELVQKVFDEALSYSPPSRQSYDPARDVAWNMLHALKALAARLDTIAPGGRAAVEKKLTELTNSGEGFHVVHTFNGNSRELQASLEAIGKMPAEFREQQYVQLAYNEGSNGDLTRAREIVNERVTNPFQRREALKELDRQEMFRAFNRGQVEVGLRILSGFSSRRERAQLLSQIATQIGPGLKRATALRVLEQARNMLSPSVQAENQEQMQALLEVARAFLRYDAKRAFEIIDPLIEQFNALSVAARTLNGFGSDYYDDEELNFQNGNAVTNVVTQMSSVLGNMAMVSFERARATADRIRAPEARLKIYLDIAQQTIQAAK
ncbi:MAG TPA: PPC domain-containing protein [Pyrinomonadaceae bacterium]|nr:PPC domain-containing protein [Pyrinomonadaceae bacterium]